MKEKTNLRVPRGILAAIAMLSVPAALFAVDDYSDYVQHVGTDTVTTPAFHDNASGRWQTNGVAEAEWPCAGMKFYVQGSSSTTQNILYTSNITVAAGSSLTYTFAGDELVLANKARLQPLLKRSVYTASNAFLHIPLLTLLPGGNIYNANAAAAGVAGVCNVKGTSSKPSEWFVSVVNGNAWAYCNLDFVGESSSVFYFRDAGKNTASNETRFMYGGDASKFYGTIRVKDPYARLVDNTATGMSFPGTLSLSGGAIFRITGGRTSTIGNLQDAGGIIDLAYSNGSSGRLVVTNSFAGGGSPIPLRFSHAFSADAETIALATFENGASDSLSADTFDLSIAGISVSESALADSPYAWKPNVIFAVTNAADGLSRTLAASHRKFVWHKEGSDSNEAGSCLLPANASRWSDGDEISEENDYFVLGTTAYVPTGSTTFGGASLTIGGASGSSANFYIRNGNHVTVPDFRWVAGASIMTYNGASSVSGKVTVVEVPDASFSIKAWNGGDDKYSFTIASELQGSGTLDLVPFASAGTDTRAFYVITGLNTNFAGRIRLYHDPFTGADKDKFNAAPDTYCVTLTVSDARNLGGPLPAFDEAGFMLAEHSLLRVKGSPVFNEATRGWSVKNVGRISVEAGQTVTITNMQITYSGEFRKEGSGTLKLGGTARFTADAVETPLEGTNVLAIAAGALTPADVTGCDGLAVTFAAGTKLVLDASATGDLKTYGLYDVKWDSPISVAGGAALPVELALPDGFDKKACHRFGICTVSPTAAQSLDVDDFAVAGVKGMRTRVSKVDNLDSSDNVVSVTFACDLSPASFIMSIR